MDVPREVRLCRPGDHPVWHLVLPRRTDLITTPVCFDVDVVPDFEDGRTLIVAKWKQLKPYENT